MLNKNIYYLDTASVLLTEIFNFPGVIILDMPLRGKVLNGQVNSAQD